MEEKTIAKLTLNKNAKPTLNFLRLFCVIFGVGLALLPQAVKAATMYMSPASGAYSVGDSFAVSIYTSSPDQAMNAASAVISFPSDKLEVISLSKTGSIMSLWVQEPSFSNSGGSISLEGIVLNPGFKGSSGKLITINFKAKSAGNAYLSFSSGSVLANDGQGTNILSALGDANFIIDVPTIVTPPKTDGPVVGVSKVRDVPSAPKATSPTHPDPDKWYNENDVLFEWDNSSDISAANVLADHSPATNPGTRSDGLFDFYEFEEVADGEWYFHIRLRNAAGWGDIAHVKFNIDTIKSSDFSAELILPEDITSQKWKVLLNASDELSGIDHYEIEIDKIIQPNIFAGNGEFTYETPSLSSGNHILVIKAVDKAGNYLEKTLEFVVEKVLPPIIKDAPLSLTTNDILVLIGDGHPNSQINLWLEKDREETFEYTTRTDKEGKFRLVVDKKLQAGIYRAWARLTTDKGVQSEVTEQITILVKPLLFVRIGAFIISILSLIVPIIALILILILVIWYFYHKAKNIRCDYRREFNRASDVMEKIYYTLHKEMNKEMDWLYRVKAKRELTREEKRLLRHINRNFNALENILGEELERIGKKIKDK